MSTQPKAPISLKELSQLLQLSPATVSRVVNGQATKFRIAKETQERVLQAAAHYGYAANNVARSLREKRTYNIGVIVPEISEGYSTAVLSGIEDELIKEGYFYFVVSHRHRPELLESYPRMMLSRLVEGIIAVDTQLPQELSVPLVAVSGHHHRKSVVNICLDHREAAEQGMTHLQSLGHKRIAYIKGQAFSSDTNLRWQATEEAAKRMGIKIDPRLVVQLESPDAGPGPGTEAAKRLLATGIPFTAVIAFNDMTAIGVIQAFKQAALRVPEDVSVLGFDDVLAASTNNPPLTTIHQPMRSMGQAAATTLLQMIHHEATETIPSEITVMPKLVVRDSTAQAKMAD